MMVRIILACNHRLIHSRLLSMLEAEPDFHLIGEAKSREEAQKMCLMMEPDVLLIGTHLCDSLNMAIELLQFISDQELSTKVILINPSELVVLFQNLGSENIHTYMVQKDSPEELFNTIRSIKKSKIWSCQLLTQALRKLVIEHKNQEEQDKLSHRELEILCLVANGLVNEEIAKFLGISAVTVKNHITHIYDKLGINSRAQVVAWAWKSGVVQQGGESELQTHNDCDL